MTPIDDRITDWLAELESELASDDPAVRHDALTDAREHLTAARAELPADADDAALDAMLADYGGPAEVAESYRSAERLLHGEPGSGGTAAAVAAAPTQELPATATDSAAEPVLDPGPPATKPGWFSVVRDPEAWSAALYMVLALPLGIAWFTWTVTGASVSISLLILVVGLPLSLAFLASIRGIALIDGRIVETLLGERMPRRSRTPIDADGAASGLVARIKLWLVDRRTWTSICYLLSMLPLGIAYFTVVVTMLSVSASLLCAPIALAFAVAASGDSVDAWTWALVVPAVPAGALGLLATLHLARFVGALHGRYAKAMLVGGDGAASRRNPVEPAASLGRAAVLAAVALVLTGGIAAAAYGIEDARTTTVHRTFQATGIQTLDLDLGNANVHLVEDRSLDEGELRVDAAVRTIKAADGAVTNDHVKLRTDGSRATLSSSCDFTFALFSAGCRINVTVRVPAGDALTVRGGTDNGDIELDGSFARVDLRTDNGDVEGRVDAERISIRSDNGDFEVELGAAARQVDLDSDNGDVEVVARGTWNVDARTDNGDTDVTVPTDPDADRSLRVQTDNGDIEVARRGEIDD